MKKHVKTIKIFRLRRAKQKQRRENIDLLEPAVHGMGRRRQGWSETFSNLHLVGKFFLQLASCHENHKCPRVWSNQGHLEPILRAVWEMVFGLFEGSVCPVAWFWAYFSLSALKVPNKQQTTNNNIQTRTLLILSSTYRNLSS